MNSALCAITTLQQLQLQLQQQHVQTMVHNIQAIIIINVRVTVCLHSQMFDGSSA